MGGVGGRGNIITDWALLATSQQEIKIKQNSDNIILVFRHLLTRVLFPDIKRQSWPPYRSVTVKPLIEVELEPGLYAVDP